MGLAHSAEKKKDRLDEFVDVIVQETDKWKKITTNIFESHLPKEDLQKALMFELSYTHAVLGLALDNIDTLMDIYPPETSSESNTPGQQKGQGRGSNVDPTEGATRGGPVPKKTTFKTFQGYHKEVKKRFEASDELVKKLKEENGELRMRLSKIASSELQRQKSTVFDLNDPNRPSKLGENYRQLYDNEWSDAYAALLEQGYEEKQAIGILRQTLSDVAQFCEAKARAEHDLLKDAISKFFCDKTMPPERDVSLYEKWRREEESPDQPDTPTGEDKKDSEEESSSDMDKETSLNFTESANTIRKKLAVDLTPHLQKAYLEDSWSNSCIPNLKPFIEKCVAICWLMAVQTPPLVLQPSENDVTSDPSGKNRKKKRHFDEHIYDYYTKNGDKIDFVVWPPLEIEGNGQLVCKGIAQGKR